jgi:hypothetical protein
MIKKDVQIASGLCFGRSTYVQKANEIILPMLLVPYKISSRIIGNYRNNVLTVVTGMLMTSVPIASVIWLH